jgi:cytochrome c oxidase cbb3-type subunit 3
MRSRVPWGALGVVLVLASHGCEREARPFQEPRGTSGASGAGHRVRSASSVPADSPYRRNAWGISEGKRLYSSYNCVGCHSRGGGGMGPPLMDHRWIYGAEGREIFESIAKGRPNGMPAFGGRIPESQIWMLVAYVQSMSGNAPLDVLPGRSDQMQAGAPENARPAQVPVTRGARQ